MGLHRIAIFAVAAVGLFVSGALAQPRISIGAKAPLWDEVRQNLRIEQDQIPRFRDKIILLLFWRTNNAESLEALDTLAAIHDDFSKLGVTVIGIVPEPNERVQSIVEGRKVPFLIVSRNNDGAGLGLEQLYAVSSYPRVYMVDTNGIIVWVGHPEDDLEDRVRKQMSKTPPAGATSKLTKDRMARAEAAFKKDDVVRAYTYAKSVRDAVERDSAPFNAAKALMEKCEEAAKELVKSAAEHFRSDEFQKAADIACQIAVRMEGTDVAKQAESEIARLRGHVRAKDFVKKGLDNAKGEVLNDEAAEYETLDQFPDALRIYEDVVSKYKDTPAGKHAEKEIKRYREDPVMSKRVAERRASEDAERWIDIGDRYRKLALNVLARRYYSDVVKHYPDTEVAKLAQDRLKGLPEKDGADPNVEPPKPKKAATDEAASKPTDEKPKPGDDKGKPGDKPKPEEPKPEPKPNAPRGAGGG
ncbi:MAG: redoxin domain-containing protein [Phycisphaerales bacterium]|nr:redoxin domain-containing protein [Phycisphaerales bacterium]